MDINTANKIFQESLGETSAPVLQDKITQPDGSNIIIPQDTLAFRNNNPGNLRFAGQRGASQGEKGFARFESPEAGYQALQNQINLDASRGHSLGSFLNKYAPPSENDTRGYLDFVEKQTGYGRDQVLSNMDVNKISQAMARMESGTRIGQTKQLSQSQAPRGLSLEQANAIFDQAMMPRETGDIDRTLGGTLKDVGVSLGKGIVGTGQAAVGLADIISGGYAGKELEDIGVDLEAAQEYLSEQYTPVQRAAFERVAKAGKEAEPGMDRFLSTLGSAMANPSTIVHSVVESLPMMAGGAGVARGLLKAGTAVSPLVAGAIGEGTVAAGSMAEATRGQTEDRLLTPTQSAMAIGTGAGTGALGLLGGKIAQKLGIGDVDTMLASGKFAETSNKGVVRRILEGGISEGAFEELPQSVQEQVWSNAALGNDLLEGVEAGAAQGLLAGAAMGGGANVFTGGVQAEIPVDTREQLTDIDRDILNLESLGDRQKTEESQKNLNDLYQQRDALLRKVRGIDQTTGVQEESYEVPLPTDPDELNKQIMSLEAVENPNPGTTELLNQLYDQREKVSNQLFDEEVARRGEAAQRESRRLRVKPDPIEMSKEEILWQQNREERQAQINDLMNEELPQTPEEATRIAEQLQEEMIPVVTEVEQPAEAVVTGEEVAPVEEVFTQQVLDEQQNKGSLMDSSYQFIHTDFGPVTASIKRTDSGKAAVYIHPLNTAKNVSATFAKDMSDQELIEFIYKNEGKIYNIRSIEPLRRFKQEKITPEEAISNYQAQQEEKQLYQQQRKESLLKQAEGKHLTQMTLNEFSVQPEASVSFNFKNIPNDPKKWTKENLTRGNNIELSGVAKFLGIPFSGNKTTKIERILKARDIRVELADATINDLYQNKNKKDLAVLYQRLTRKKAPGRFSKIALAEQILNLRDKQREAGKRTLAEINYQRIQKDSIREDFQAREDLISEMESELEANQIEQDRLDVNDPMRGELELNAEELREKIRNDRRELLIDRLANRGQFEVRPAVHYGSYQGGKILSSMLHSGEGSSILGPGLYFSTDLELGKNVYSKYGKETKINIELDNFYDPINGPRLPGVDAALVEGGLDTKAKLDYARNNKSNFNHGRGDIGALVFTVGPEKARQLFAKHGIQGAKEKLPSGSYEIAVFDDNLLPELNKEKITKKDFYTVEEIRVLNEFDSLPIDEVFFALDESPYKEVLSKVDRFGKPTQQNSTPEAVKTFFEIRVDIEPGQGIALPEIQKMYKDQEVFQGDDGTISVRFRNGKGATIQNIQDAGNGFISYAIDTGQMSKDGKILGVTTGTNILLDSEFADNATLWHENKHVLDNLGMITERDNALLNKEFNKLRKANRLNFGLSTHENPRLAMEENRANMFAQIMVEREAYRGTALGKVIQKIMDFFNGLLGIGRQTLGGFVREVESGKIYERETGAKEETTLPMFQQAGNINSKEFKNWFKDSKVVDDIGEPLIVYHNTNQEFTQFAPNRPAYFTPDKQASSRYGERNIPVYLSIDKLAQENDIRQEAKNFGLKTDNIETYELLWNDRFIDHLKNKGYDGFTFTDDYEGRFKTFGVFDSRNIKSISNIGKWSQTDPDIRFEIRDQVISDLTKSEQKISDDVYRNIYEQQSSLIEKLNQNIRKTGREINRGMNKYLGMISTNLKKINPMLEAKVRKLGFDTTQAIKNDLETAKPLLDKLKDMSAQDKSDWHWARVNGDSVRINQITEKYGITETYRNVREALNRIRRDGEAVGYNIGFIDEYWPRILKDRTGFLQATKGLANEPVFSDALKAQADKLGTTVDGLDEGLKADIISNIILGRPSGLGGPVNIRQRYFDEVPPEYAKFYMDSDAALMSYIYSMNKKIEARKFFGKVPERIARIKKDKRTKETRLANLIELENNLVANGQDTTTVKEQIDSIKGDIQIAQNELDKYGSQDDFKENIGSYVMDLMIKEKLKSGTGVKANDEQALKDILTARFNEKGTTGLANVYKNLSYIDTMGSPISAITQIGDLAWAVYVGGLTPRGIVNSVKNIGKAIIGKSDITREDIGITRIAQEFADGDTLSNAVSKVFNLVGIEKLDRIGKEALINNSFDNYRRKANRAAKDAKEMERFKAELRPMFGNKSEKVINELLDSNVASQSEDVKLLVYSRLLDFQPADLSETPEAYLNAGNGRLFYMLKMFTLKQFDVFRREVWHNIKTGERDKVIEGLGNATRLMAILSLANAGADELKDWLLGKDTKFEDHVIENLLTLGGASRYLRMQTTREGIGSGLAGQILPPFKFIDAISKDVMTDTRDGLRSVDSIPLVGKLYYWHLGRGKDKRESVEEQDFKKASKDFKRFNKDLEDATDKRLFLRSNLEMFKQKKLYDNFNNALRGNKATINKLKDIEQTPNVRKRLGQLEQQRKDLIKRYFEMKNNL